MIFIFKSAITLTLLYCCFFAFLSRETFHRFNRIALIGIMVATLTIPLLQFKTESPTIINRELIEIEQDFAGTAIFTQGMTRTTEKLDWVDCTIIIYIAGVAISICLTAIQILTLIRYLRGGLRHTDDYGITVILKNGNVAPFSIFRYIVMSVNDYETNRDCILIHEQEHIRQGHTYDLILWEVIKTMQWFNPFIWLLGRDLRCIHEYEADQAVIKQDIDAKAYQLLLVEKAVGKRLQPLANSLNHNSLKRRIMMMYRKKSSRWLMLKSLCAIPVAVFAVAAFAKPAIIDRTENAISTAEKKVTKMVRQTVEKKTAPAIERTSKTAPDTGETAGNSKHTAVKVQATEDKASVAEKEDSIREVPIPENKPAMTQDGRPIYTDMPAYKGRSSIDNGVRIRRTKECTYVTLIGTCNADVGMYKIGGKENQTFIEDIETGDHYKLRRIMDEGIVLGGNGFFVAGMKGKRWAVTLEFPPIPDHVKKIRFWHLDSWTYSERAIINIHYIEEP